MKKILLLLCMIILLPCYHVSAADYNLSEKKSVAGAYAGVEEYNYYKIQPKKNAFICLNASTSSNNPLLIDICNENREVIASNISISKKENVLHKVKKNVIYYVRVKGVEGETYDISYKMQEWNTLTYAKAYKYTVTNASFPTQKDAITLKVKTTRTGNLHFMTDSDSGIYVQYLNSKKKLTSKTLLMEGKALTGIGVKSNSIYYIRLFKPEETIEGVTVFNNIKYQINRKNISGNNTKAKATVLKSQNKKYTETFLPAGAAYTKWYKFEITKDKPIRITLRSGMMQNAGKHLQLDLCNSLGKRINTGNAIIIEEEAYASYAKKKYTIHNQSKDIDVKLPKGTYYIKVISKTKTTSGSYELKWNYK